MARMPGAVWTGEHSPKIPMTRYDVLCLHTIVGHDPAHAAHFSVGGDGKITQSRDTKYRSAASLDGNYRSITIEAEDMGAPFPEWTGSDVPGYTAKQIASIVKIYVWVHETHDIPLQLCPDSKPHSRGLAYHRQGIDGNFGTFKFPGRVKGGEVWTEHRGKVCPGDRRIAARPAILKGAKLIVTEKKGLHMNTVEGWRAAIEKANKDFQIPENREAANAMQDAVKKILEKGPKS